MLQEIIVYLILIATSIHLLHQTVLFFMPKKNHLDGPSCSGGSCSNCSLKLDLSSIQPSHQKSKLSPNKFIGIKQWL